MNEQALELLKARLGISTSVRDSYLQKRVDDVIAELETINGLVLDGSNASHLMFVVDLAAWRYENKDSENATPRHLKFRLHNLIISNVGVNNG